MKHRHSLFLFVGCLGMVAGLLSSCKQEEKVIVVTAVSINQPSAEMIIGETLQLSASVLPVNAIDKEVIWATSKKSVASVDQNGLVTALSEGVSTISAMAGGKTGTCTITVSKGYIAVESIIQNCRWLKVTNLFLRLRLNPMTQPTIPYLGLLPITALRLLMARAK